MNPQMRKDHLNAMIRICSFLSKEGTEVLGCDGGVWYFTGTILMNGTNYTIRYYTGDCCFGEGGLVFFLQGQESFRIEPMFSHETDDSPFGHECLADQKMLKQIMDTLKPLDNGHE